MFSCWLKTQPVYCIVQLQVHLYESMSTINQESVRKLQRCIWDPLKTVQLSFTWESLSKIKTYDINIISRYIDIRNFYFQRSNTGIGTCSMSTQLSSAIIFWPTQIYCKLHLLLRTGLLFHRLESQHGATSLHNHIGRHISHSNAHAKHNNKHYYVSVEAFARLHRHPNMTSPTHLHCLMWSLWTMITFSKPLLALGLHLLNKHEPHWY